ncbi:tRNA pseudouridine(32) synthase, mitochondrial [Cyphellophora attinorum]|uniref:tRNA pseudouridine(32) synthase, mitochondrial n=1 Tax=Cyphellophora attinorum TaxID=1664694 RepID=A0A0N1H8H6_9EURO|nr:tRNA pseudouridine(32) synthase, mitochondrial [Phialophora attinorum]KPI38233.1 tRNA pseudouridine(32) synthase, mitochondrial [Phialophora attinorum]
MALATTKQPRNIIDDIHQAGHPPAPIDLPDVIAAPVGDPWPRPYYFENGLRRVAPYHYTYNTFCKQRWRGRTILDIFSSEFRDRDREYYRHAIESGHITINNSPCVDTNTIVKNGDVVGHTLHRHEPPVSAQPVGVIHEDDNMIVINKPAGIPVHPAGRYKFNSVIEIMRAERGNHFNPLPCNRLDRLTSGVMFVGKTAKEAEKIGEKLRSRTVQKEYVARVVGRFPDGEGAGSESAQGNGKGGVVKCDESILQISPILGLNRARATGKRSSDNEDSSLPTTDNLGYSIVHCLPLTGRTHQIRVHLQFLGHPISNDPIYSNRKVFGNGLAQNDASSDNDAEIIARLAKMGKSELPETSETTTLTVSNIDQTRQMTVSEAQSLKTSPPESVPASKSHLRHEGEPHAGIPQGTIHASSALDHTSPTTSSTGPDPGPSNTTTLDLSQGHNDPNHGHLIAAHDAQVASYNKRKGEKLTGEYCPVCETPLYSDPLPSDLGIYLHALAYGDKGGEWRHASSLPDWARNPREAKQTDEAWPEWERSGLGWEDEGVGDEAEVGRRRNHVGMERNRELNGNKNGLAEDELSVPGPDQVG